MSTTGIVPFKTDDGHDELARRTRRLGQRHRTVLLLVDGRRTVDQVLALAHAAGVAEHHYRELLEAGLIGLPDGVLAAPTLPMPLDEPPAPPTLGAADEIVGHVELPLPDAACATLTEDVASATEAPAPLTPAESMASEVQLQASVAPEAPVSMSVAASVPALAPTTPSLNDAVQASPSVAAPVVSPPVETASAPDSLMPSMHSLLPDSQLDDPLTPPPAIDGPLEEAREILIRAVRAEAPVAGQLTLLKLRHASDRADLEALLDEVEQRISRPRKMVIAAQTLRHVRHLLCMPPSTAFTMY